MGCFCSRGLEVDVGSRGETEIILGRSTGAVVGGRYARRSLVGCGAWFRRGIQRLLRVLGFDRQAGKCRRSLIASDRRNGQSVVMTLGRVTSVTVPSGR